MSVCCNQTSLSLLSLFYGVLSEKWMRYEVIMVGIILIFVGFFDVIVTLLTLYFVHLIAVVGLSLVLTILSFFDKVYLKLI